MKNVSRRGWIPPRDAAVKVVVVCLALVVAMTAGAQLCLAAGDYPLKPLQPLPIFETTPGSYGVAVSGSWTISAGPIATINLRLAGPPVGSWLYIAGRDRNLPAGDPEIRVAITNGAGVTRVNCVTARKLPKALTTERAVPARYARRLQRAKAKAGSGVLPTPGSRHSGQRFIPTAAAGKTVITTATTLRLVIQVGNDRPIKKKY